MNPIAVGAIVVAYHSEQKALEKLAHAITAQVQKIVLVDNTPTMNRAPWIEDFCYRFGIHYISQGGNSGIAAAQNTGIRYLESQAVDFYLFLDHDSVPAPNMVACLLESYTKHNHDSHPIAAIGPFSFIPKLQINIPFIAPSKKWYEKQYCHSPQQVFSVSHLISSGTLVPRQAMQAIGTMDESLFIDYVDIEWCLRAQARGFRLLGCCNAYMEHDLGDAPLELFGKQFLTHSPIRHYYLVRNAILLYRRSYISLGWKCNDALHVLLKMGLYCLFLKPRLEHIQMAFKGLRDGIGKRSGRITGSFPTRA